MRRTRATLLVDVLYCGVGLAIVALLLSLDLRPDIARPSWLAPTAVVLAVTTVVLYEVRKRLRRS
jgi:hypothetical protein